MPKPKTPAIVIPMPVTTLDFSPDRIPEFRVRLCELNDATDAIITLLDAWRRPQLVPKRKRIRRGIPGGIK